MEPPMKKQKKISSPAPTKEQKETLSAESTEKQKKTFSPEPTFWSILNPNLIFGPRLDHRGLAKTDFPKEFKLLCSKYRQVNLINLMPEPFDADTSFKDIPNIRETKMPVVDGTAPTRDQMQKLYKKCKTDLGKKDTLVYVMCLGGHGRSACVAGILLAMTGTCEKRKIPAMVQKAHDERREFPNEIYRGCESPQTADQQALLAEFCEE